MTTLSHTFTSTAAAFVLREVSSKYCVVGGPKITERHKDFFRKFVPDFWAPLQNVVLSKSSVNVHVRACVCFYPMLFRAAACISARRHHAQPTYPPRFKKPPPSVLGNCSSRTISCSFQRHCQLVWFMAFFAHSAHLKHLFLLSFSTFLSCC